jgi:hypothetical protein
VGDCRFIYAGLGGEAGTGRTHRDRFGFSISGPESQDVALVIVKSGLHTMKISKPEKEGRIYTGRKESAIAYSQNPPRKVTQP